MLLALAIYALLSVILVVALWAACGEPENKRTLVFMLTLGIFAVVVHGLNTVIEYLEDLCE